MTFAAIDPMTRGIAKTTGKSGKDSTPFGTQTEQGPADPPASVLINAEGLGITSLRISVTDQCNEHCLYCRPTPQTPGQSRTSEPMSREEIVGIVSALARAGLSAVRLTGGEPLLRKDLEEIVAALASVQPRPAIRLTTNGLGLSSRAQGLAEAGLDRVNVSLDSIHPSVYKTITGKDALGRVLTGIEAAIEAGLGPVRTNTVVCAGINDEELGSICKTVWNMGAVPRFIELMPLGPLGRKLGTMVDADGIRRRIENDQGPLFPLGRDRDAGPAFYYETKQGMQVGIIASVTGHICEACNRGRLSTSGGLHGCLTGPVDADLMTAWHSGGKEAVLNAAARAVSIKRPRDSWPTAVNMVDMGG